MRRTGVRAVRGTGVRADRADLAVLGVVLVWEVVVARGVLGAGVLGVRWTGSAGVAATAVMAVVVVAAGVTDVAVLGRIDWLMSGNGTPHSPLLRMAHMDHNWRVTGAYHSGVGATSAVMTSSSESTTCGAPAARSSAPARSLGA